MVESKAAAAKERVVTEGSGLLRWQLNGRVDAECVGKRESLSSDHPFRTTTNWYYVRCAPGCPG